MNRWMAILRYRKGQASASIPIRPFSRAIPIAPTRHGAATSAPVARAGTLLADCLRSGGKGAFAGRTLGGFGRRNSALRRGRRDPDRAQPVDGVGIDCFIGTPFDLQA